MADVPVADLIKRWEALNSGRGTWLNHWEDLARLMLPRRMGFTSSHVNGDRRTDDIYDGTPMQAARGLANALGGFMRPEGQAWFHLKAEDDDVDNSDAAKAWMADSEDRLNNAIQNPKARFRQGTGECDLDLVVFGTGILFESESQNRRNLLFQSVHLKDGVVVYSDEGEAEGLFRMREYTLRQAIDRFGEENLSTDTREKLSGGDRTKTLDEKLKILHAVYPRKDASPGAMLARNLPFADIWLEVAAKHVVKTSGFHEFPFIVPRWDTSSGEDYGRSPGMIALPDASTLQAMGETMLVAGQRVADPPLMAPNDGSFSEANTFPGGITYYDVETAAQLRGNPFFPLETGANLPITRDMQMDVREQVMNAFFKNILNLPVDGPEMTATEVMQRKEEFIREIGPVFGRLESDYTAPMVNRAFNIMLRNNAFLPIPDELQGKSVRFEYESPVTKIKKQVDAAAARMWVQEHILAAKETGRADILDTVNFDRYSRFSAEAAGIPNDIVNGAEAVAAIREQRAAAQQQAQQAMQAQQAAEIAKTGAEAANTAGMVEQPAKAA